MGAPRRSSMSRPGDWNCSQCSNHNFAYRVECNKCKAPKDNATQELQPPPGQQAYNQQGGGQQGGYPNDWLCGSCGNDNFARRTECNKCKQPRDPNSKLVEPPSQQGGYGQQQGGYGHQGYGGGVQTQYPNDWLCSSCGNDNFARRTECNRCKQPKDAVNAGEITNSQDAASAAPAAELGSADVAPEVPAAAAEEAAADGESLPAGGPIHSSGGAARADRSFKPY